jgi:hypothetical protein
VCDDGGDVTVVQHHLLVVAAALVGETGAHMRAHEQIDAYTPLPTAGPSEELLVLCQKSHI